MAAAWQHGLAVRPLRNLLLSQPQPTQPPTQPPTHLQVRRAERDTFRCVGLTQKPCASASAAMHCMQGALHTRATRAHRLNEHSSRSHCIMTFTFASQEVGGRGLCQGAAKCVFSCLRGLVIRLGRRSTAVARLCTVSPQQLDGTEKGAVAAQPARRALTASSGSWTLDPALTDRVMDP